MKVLGLDVFVQASGIPKCENVHAAFRLEGITNRGTKVWPGTAPRIQLTDVYRCRFLSSRADKVAGNEECIELLKALEEGGLPWVHVEKLLEFQGKAGFSGLGGAA
jgi:isocitrate dehydrogenase